MRLRGFWPLLGIICGLLSPKIVRAQLEGPVLIIQGSPDTTSTPPEVRTYASVIDPSTAETISGLTVEAFRLREAGTDIGEINVEYRPVGLAIVVVVDRGGISAPGDPRLRQATDLVRELVARLTVTGSPDDDVIAIVGISEEGVLEPLENFTWNPVDINLVRNALVMMEEQPLQGTTPLYDGLDKALSLLLNNPDGLIREALTHRRKLILVFSDGIDRNYSNAAREEDIIRKANRADIAIYTVGMARPNRPLSSESTLVRLARQTGGAYQLHNNEKTYQQVLALMDRLMTQRYQYLLTYPTRRPKGDYTLAVRVQTPIGVAERVTSFSSVLERPQIALVSPAGGTAMTVTYSRQDKGFHSTPVVLRTEIRPIDGVMRFPAAVQYFANGILIGSSTLSPTYDFSWDLATVVIPTEQVQMQDFTLAAAAEDLYLGERMESPPVTIRVTWEPVQYTPKEWALLWMRANWWLVLIWGTLTVGILILLVMLIRTRGELARRAIVTTTGVLRGITRRLGVASAHASAKLVIVQGTGVGREFSINAPLIKVGRDPQFADFPLYDDYVSNPHFSLLMEHGQCYITDEGSINHTFVNGVPLEPFQRVPLPPGAFIDAGQVRLQFIWEREHAAPLPPQPETSPPPPDETSASGEAGKEDASPIVPTKMTEGDTVKTVPNTSEEEPSDGERGDRPDR